MSGDPYPMDPTYDELVRREARLRAVFRYDHDTPNATKVAIENSMETALREQGWKPDEY